MNSLRLGSLLRLFGFCFILYFHCGLSEVFFNTHAEYVVCERGIIMLESKSMKKVWLNAFVFLCGCGQNMFFSQSENKKTWTFPNTVWRGVMKRAQG